MSLPVLKNDPTATLADLVRLFHQSQLEWSRHLGEETELDFGRWICNLAFPKSTEANCLLDAYLVPGLSAMDIVKQMSATMWRRCTINPTMPQRTIGLTDELAAQGWIAKPTSILYRRQTISPAAITQNNLTIIPARASYRLYEQLMQERAATGNGPEAEAAMLHLDDHHFDVLLALQAGKPVGSIGVLSSGEVGTVREWYVPDPARFTEIGRILMDRVMEICSRGMLKHVMIGLPDTTGVDRAVCSEFGYENIGQWIAWDRSDI